MGVRCIDRDKLKKADSWSLALAMWRESVAEVFWQSCAYVHVRGPKADVVSVVSDRVAHAEGCLPLWLVPWLSA